MLCFEGIPLPNYWAPMLPDPQTGKADSPLVNLTSDLPEYWDVARQFQLTVKDQIITSIERVQNPLLYRMYMLKKEKMNEVSGGQNNEKKLFHGTEAKNVVKINSHGFNRSFVGEHGKATIFTFFILLLSFCFPGSFYFSVFLTVRN